MRIKSAPVAAQPSPRYAACASIKDFGAMGDGTADDAVALQMAINNVGSGCSIFFPPGVYKLASNVTISKDITLQLGPQVEIRQFARLIPSANATWSLTVQGEGPGTSVWGQAIDYPFWSGSPSRRFKNLRLINLEFRPYTSLEFPHYYGGSTDLFEATLVTFSKGNSNQFKELQVRTGESMLTTASLNVLRDVVLTDINMQIDVQDADLEIRRLIGTISSWARILVARSSGTGQALISSCSLRIGFMTLSQVEPVIMLKATGNSARLFATINDVDILSSSRNAAVSAQNFASNAEINLLVNALRFTVTVNSSTGYAIKTQDTDDSVIRAVLCGCFLRATVPHSDAAIQGTLSNPNSLRTLAGVDQRGWASLT
jgi:hypothetical protein